MLVIRNDEAPSGGPPSTFDANAPTGTSQTARATRAAGAYRPGPGRLIEPPLSPSAGEDEGRSTPFGDGSKWAVRVEEVSRPVIRTPPSSSRPARRRGGRRWRTARRRRARRWGGRPLGSRG